MNFKRCEGTLYLKVTAEASASIIDRQKHDFATLPNCCIVVFLKMGQSRPLFVYFRHFLDTISIIQIEKA